MRSDKPFLALTGQQYSGMLNLGMACRGLLLMLATIQEYVAHLKSRLLLWFYFAARRVTSSDFKTSRALSLRRKLTSVSAEVRLPLRAAERVTTTTQVVMASTGEVVVTGLVDSLSRLGGNVTGSAASSRK